jgi:hypothetical protein
MQEINMKQSLACCLFHVHFSFGFAYSSTLKMEAACSSEMLVDFQRAVQRYIP